MKTYNIKDMKHGWFIGNFEPSMLKTDQFEVGHHFWKEGTSPVLHKHNVLTEYNYIVKGCVRIPGDQLLYAGSMFVFEPGDVSDISFMTDTELIVIKVPSIPNDKEII